jgi:hypothetical protein
LFQGTFTSAKIICRRRLKRHLVSPLDSSITDAVVNYSEFHTHEDLKLLDVTRITIIFCRFAHLYNVTTFTLYKEKDREVLNLSVFSSLPRTPRRATSWDAGPPGLAVTVSQSSGQDPGALGEELGTPTKAGAAPPRRGLPDEGGCVPGPLLVRRELPPAGRWAESSIAPPPEEGAAGIGARP